MYFKQIYDYCLAEKIGSDGISKKLLHIAEKKAVQELGNLNRKNLRLFSITKENSDIAEIEKYAKKIRKNFRNIIILGTGGSSLCGKLLIDIKKNKKQKFIFVDNVDPAEIAYLIETLNFKKSFFIVISKSGETLETVSQFMAFHQAAVKILGRKKAATQFIIITEPKNNILSKFAKKFAIKTLTHDPHVGGRFSTLTAVGMLPAAIAGLDIRKIREGAAEFIKNPATAIIGAAVNICMMEKLINTNIFMPYAEKLSGFASWYRQVWAESLGKKGLGSNPVKAMGAVDQHSQMQLYLDGPRDKFFTFLTVSGNGDNNKFSAEYIVDPSINYLRSKTMADVMRAEQLATIQTFINHKLPTRVIEIKKLDEKTIGSLFMHFCFETILTGMMLGINPFDQPAVEEGKILARKNLGGKK